MNTLQLIANNAALAGVMAHNLPSPCVSICQMHAATGLCTGCLRTLEEISIWGQLDDTGKRVIWRDIAARAAHALAMEKAS
ncbi:MAG: DUF1289 domain-containing protein [Burkholderiaceae bacterium]|nr:DUF1289 domain-containing protein [Burkholderiaceae bacterium]MDZ4145547.1 DUF1289 domain-containing protein [Burkholderiales bacterium]